MHLFSMEAVKAFLPLVFLSTRLTQMAVLSFGTAVKILFFISVSFVILFFLFWEEFYDGYILIILQNFRLLFF
jgi:hypothetical protein